MGKLNNFKQFIGDEEVNERWTIFEEHIWANVKSMTREIKNLDRFESPKKAIKTIEMIENHLKDIKADIKHKS